MLLPAQVIPFLTHSDYSVRYHAANFLGDAHDPAPATADDLWRVFDLYGMQRDESTVEGALVCLARVPCTDAAITRLLEHFADGPVGLCRLHLTAALDGISFDLLRVRWDEIAASAGIPEDSKGHLETRLDLASRPLELLWDDLIKHATSLCGKRFGDFDLRISQRLIEALARHPDVFGPRALDTLHGETTIDWLEPLCLDLIAAMRYEPAVEVLLDVLRDENAPHEFARRALNRIGSVDVVQRIAGLYPQQGWDFRLSAGSVLGDIKRPESEAAVLDLLPAEQDGEARTLLAIALCDLCSREGVEIVRQMAVDGTFDDSIDEPEALVLTVGQMVGYEPPEAPQWREAVALREAELRQVRAEMMRGSLAPNSAARASEKAKRPRPQRTYDAAPVPEERASPRVGRNDLCPCGSGKKFKKCCLKQAGMT